MTDDVDDLPTSVCDRCGNFAKSPKMLMGRLACEDCLAIPGVDFLQTFKDEVWGRRDGFVALVGLGLVVQLLALFGFGIAIAQGGPVFNYCFFAIIFVAAANSAAYVARFQLARLMLVLLSFLLPAANVAVVVGFDGAISPEQLGQFIVQAIIGFLVSLAAYRSTRNKLAFKIDVSDLDLEKCYTTFKDNPVARYGSSFGVLGLLFPIFAPIGLILSIKGLRAVDPQAWPPVGNRQAAIIGLVGSILGLIWGSLLALSLVTRL